MLSQDQIRFYHENGYLVVDNILPQQTVLEPVRQEYENLLNELYDTWCAEGKIPNPDASKSFESKLIDAYCAGCDWFQPMDISLPGNRIHADTPMHFGPAIFDMIRSPALLDLVETLIGPEITSNPIQHVRIKPPAANLIQNEVRSHLTKTDWHQDRGVGLQEADQTDMITVWCAITDATAENGCLQVIPKGHKIGMLPHCPKTQTAIADGFIDETAGLPLPVKSGGVVILHPLLPHASLSNKTNGIRWSFDLRFNRTGQPTGRPHFPDFIARSRLAPEAELTDWKKWRENWQDARARLAVAEHIDIHRWSSDAPACA